MIALNLALITLDLNVTLPVSGATQKIVIKTLKLSYNGKLFVEFVEKDTLLLIIYDLCVHLWIIYTYYLHFLHIINFLLLS